MDSLFCRLESMDPHFRCSHGKQTPNWKTPGVACLPQSLVDLTVKSIPPGGAIVFAGDSTTLQMWLATLLLLAPVLKDLRCPNLGNAYQGEWGNDGNLRCAISSEQRIRLCYLKVGMKRSKSSISLNSTAVAIRNLLDTVGMDNRFVLRGQRSALQQCSHSSPYFAVG